MGGGRLEPDGICPANLHHIQGSRDFLFFVLKNKVLVIRAAVFSVVNTFAGK